MASIAKNYRKDHDEWVIGGKLTLLPGAVVDDQSKAGVVILPETELFVTDDSTGDETTFYGLRNKYEVAPVVGGTYKLLFGGDEHTSKAVDLSAVMGEGAVAMGNTDLMGLADMGIVAPDPTAQYVFCAFPNGSTDDVEGTTYGLLVASGLSEHPTLSIVEKAETASAGGGGMYIVNCHDMDMDAQTCTVDKTFAEVLAAYQAGQHVVFRGTIGNAEVTMPVASVSMAEGRPFMIIAQAVIETSIFLVGLRTTEEADQTVFQVVPLIQ